MIIIDDSINIAAVSPDGTIWFIGEDVLIGQDGYYRKAEDPPIVRRIAGFVDGDWSANTSAIGAAYFKFSDGWMTRPWLVSKLPTEPRDRAGRSS